MNSIDVRRCYMENYECERTIPSYKDLIPQRNFDCFDEGDETPDEHYRRLNERFNRINPSI